MPRERKAHRTLASPGQRVGAGLIDYIIPKLGIGVIVLILFSFLGESGIILLFGLLLYLAYYIIPEARKGQTPGKQLLDLKTVREDGTDIDWNESTIRNLIRIIEVDLITPLIPLGLILITDKSQRLGDMLGGTIVVQI